MSASRDGSGSRGMRGELIDEMIRASQEDSQSFHAIVDKVKDVYVDPNRGMAGEKKLQARVTTPDMTNKMRRKHKAAVKHFVQHADQVQMGHKPMRPKRYLRTVAPPYSFQVDILDLSGGNFKLRFGRNRYLLTFIDVLSRKAYMYPMSNKFMSTWLQKFDDFVQDVNKDLDGTDYLTHERVDAIKRKIDTAATTATSASRSSGSSASTSTSTSTGAGAGAGGGVDERCGIGAASTAVVSIAGDDEFNKRDLRTKCNEYGICLITTVSKVDHITHGDRLGVINRFVRTFKRKLLNYVKLYKTVDVADAVPRLLANYNSDVHSELYGHTPDDAFVDLDLLRELRNRYNAHNREVMRLVPRFDVGDPVRVVVQKGLFDKEKFQFSERIYHVHRKDFNRYIVCGTDSADRARHSDEACDIHMVNATFGTRAKSFPRRFKPHELKKVDVAKMITLRNPRRRGEKEFVQAEEAERPVELDEELGLEKTDRAVRTFRKDGFTEAEARNMVGMTTQELPQREARKGVQRAVDTLKPKQRAASKKAERRAESDVEAGPCSVCDLTDSSQNNPMLKCIGCTRPYHRLCHDPLPIMRKGSVEFYCESCMTGYKLVRINFDKVDGVSFVLKFPMSEPGKWNKLDVVIRDVHPPLLEQIKKTDAWKRFVVENQVQLDKYCSVKKNMRNCLFDLYVIESIDDVKILGEAYQGVTERDAQKLQGRRDLGEKRLMFLVKWQGYADRDWRSHASLLVNERRPVPLQVFMQTDPKWQRFRATQEYREFHKATLRKRLTLDVPNDKLGLPLANERAKST